MTLCKDSGGRYLKWKVNCGYRHPNTEEFPQWETFK